MYRKVLLLWSISALFLSVYSQTCNVKEVNWGNPMLSPPQASIMTNGPLSLDITLNALTYYRNATYHIDFGMFMNAINLPSNCENRLASSYTGKTFDQFWDATDNPSMGLGSTSYLAYPPPNVWTVNFENWDMSSNCPNVTYATTLSAYELVQCVNRAGAWSITITMDGLYLILSGSVYVSIVAPMNRWNESDGYHESLLLAQSFKLNVSLTTYANGMSTHHNFNVYIVSVADANGNFTLRFFTKATGIFVTNPMLTLSPTNITEPIVSDDNKTLGDCIVGQQCIQWWRLTSSFPCPYDFTGQYDFDWEIWVCANSSASSCRYAYAHAPFTFWLRYYVGAYSCAPNQYLTYVTSATDLYANSSYTAPKPNIIVTVGFPLYVESYLILPALDKMVFEALLWNVWVCASLDPSLSIDQQTQLGGCFSPNLLDPGAIEVFVNGTAVNLNAMKITVLNDNDKVRYYFDIPRFNQSGYFYVHTQLKLRTTIPPVRRRRLRKKYDLFSHSIQRFTVQSPSNSISNSISNSNSNSISNNDHFNTKGMSFTAIGGYTIGALSLLMLIYVLIRAKKPHDYSKLRSHKMEKWDEKEVAVWISDDLGLADLYEKFLYNNIDGKRLLDMNQDELKYIGVSSLGYRKTILKSVGFYRS